MSMENLLCSCTYGTYQGDKQEETSHSISDKCQLGESEEGGRRPLSYCFAQGWHRSWCQSSKFNHIWQDNWRQISISTLNTEKGSIWKFYSSSTWENSMHSWGGKVGSTGNYFTLQQPMHHLIYSPETVAILWEYSSLATLWKWQEVPADSKGNPKRNPHSLQLTSTNPRCMVFHHIIWKMEEKLSHSTQWSLYKEQLQGMPLKKQDILRVFSDVFTGIGKFPGPPYKFQLKPNGKPARHAPKQVPVHLQEAFH